MRIALVVATDLDGTIGRDNRLPWRLPADLQHFKRITMGKPMIMGRKTWDSIGRPLPGRTSIVLTRQRDFAPVGVEVARTPEEALALARAALTAGATAGADDGEVAIIGGADIFRIFLPRADRIYWTEVQARIPGDVQLPPFDRSIWHEVERQERPADTENAYDLVFCVLERKASAARL